jgi:hypothetical protein
MQRKGNNPTYIKMQITTQQQHSSFHLQPNTLDDGHLG